MKSEEFKLDKSEWWCFDIETFLSVFSVEFQNWGTGEKHTFEISEYRNDAKELYRFMIDRIITPVNGTISFNGMFFDVPVMHHFMLLYEAGIREALALIRKIFEKAQWIIHKAERFNRQRNSRWIDIDLFKINHYDNKAKVTSLKKIEVFLHMETVEELPHAFDDPYLDIHEVREVIDYMSHDVTATRLFADYCQPSIEFRFGLLSKFGFPVLNYSDSKIGSELMNKELIDQMGYDKLFKMVEGKRVPVQSHYPNGFSVAPLIFDYIKFESNEGNAILDFFKKQTLFGTKGVFDSLEMNDVGELAKYVDQELTATEKRKHQTRQYLDDLYSTIDADHVNTIGNLDKNHQFIIDGIFDNKGFPILPETENYKGMGTYRQKYWAHLVNWSAYKEKWPNCKETHSLPTKIKKLNLKLGNLIHYWGTGGLHASIEPGIYRSDEKYILVDVDVVSFYPSLSIVNFLAPKHLNENNGRVWSETYGSMKTARISYPKGSPENKALKLALNSTYGNSGNQFSPVHDPAYTVATCVSGQLTLTMLMEQWLKIPGLKLISANTDGANAAVPREHLDWFNKICEDFEKITNLELEQQTYKVMFHKDCNNYIWVS